MFVRSLCLLSAYHSRSLHLKPRSLDASTHTERSRLAPAVCSCCTLAPWWIKSSGSKAAVADTHQFYTAPCFRPPSPRGSVAGARQCRLQPFNPFFSSPKPPQPSGPWRKGKGWHQAAFAGCCQHHQHLPVSSRLCKEDTGGASICPYTFGLFFENTVIKIIKKQTVI